MKCWMVIPRQFAYFYYHLCRALSTSRRLTTVSNMNLEDEVRESLIVQAGNGSTNQTNIQR